MSRPGLIAKKVPVRTKGKTVLRTYWVKPGAGKPGETAPAQKKGGGEEGAPIAQTSATPKRTKAEARIKAEDEAPEDTYKKVTAHLQRAGINLYMSKTPQSYENLQKLITRKDGTVDHEYFNKMYPDLPGTEWTTRSITGYFSTGPHAVYSGNFKFPGIQGEMGGDATGYFTRTYRQMSDGQKYVEHDLFKLDPAVQGKGTMKDLFRAHFPVYEEQGVSFVKVGTAWNGRYTWLRTGFEPDEPMPQLLSDRMRNYTDEQGNPYSARRLEPALRGIPSYEVATMSFELKKRGSDKVERVSVKDLMLHPFSEGWNGKLPVDREHPNYQHFRKYVGLDKEPEKKETKTPPRYTGPRTTENRPGPQSPAPTPQAEAFERRRRRLRVSL